MGALGASLGAMVANISSHKRGWDDRWAYFSEWAERGQRIKDELLRLVDDDTTAFEQVMVAMRLPKESAEEKAVRKQAIQEATKSATLTPFRTLELVMEVFPLCREMIVNGLAASASDAAVGALCARAAAHGAFLNVKINTGSIEDADFVNDLLGRGQQMIDAADAAEKEILSLIKW
jgi:glutamate formiminotransferase/formiminotetrahydrofolate cyclodeaminase